MPPKKKLNKTNEDPNPAETQPKPAEKTESLPEPKKQQPKPERQEQKVIPQPPLATSQGPAARLEQTLTQQPTQSKEATEQKTQKISIDDAAKLSEEQRLKLRRLRFGAIGTDTTIEEAEKIKQERLKKFGGTTPEDDREALERRKQKFSNSSAIEAQDPQIAKRRLEKFGITGIVTASDDKTTLEQRKKKFGNPEVTLSLDDEISKNKHIKKFHPKFNNHKRFGNDRQGRR